jgi:hypothetical protein
MRALTTAVAVAAVTPVSLGATDALRPSAWASRATCSPRQAAVAACHRCVAAAQRRTATIASRIVDSASIPFPDGKPAICRQRSDALPGVRTPWRYCLGPHRRRTRACSLRRSARVRPPTQELPWASGRLRFALFATQAGHDPDFLATSWRPPQERGFYRANPDRMADAPQPLGGNGWQVPRLLERQGRGRPRVSLSRRPW